jgi:outer membrane protein OmpA-like peptidoglycan-associated protein
MENESLYKDLGPEATRKGLPTVKWADLNENNQMFGLDGGSSLFSNIFSQAGEAWRNRGYIQQVVDASQAKDDSFLREIYKANPVPRPSRERPVTPLTQAECEREGIMDKPIQVQFAMNSSVLDATARRILNGITTPQTFTNASYFCIAGNTDNVGNPQSNVKLSERRAQSVVDYLAERYNRNPTFFTHFGYGDSHPVAPNDTTEGKAKNRRTDIKVVTR